ncbi:hypothetical protein C8F01DRAFT_1248826 [Mycena amicta]|nr:hypothetical protein C8F01DRAFT_1248826 [Mycena amicta]
MSPSDVGSTATAAQHRFRLHFYPDQEPTPPLPPPEPSSSNGPGPFLVFEQMPFHKSKHREKFNLMRDRYERVIVRQEEYQRELDVATTKLKRLQAENDLLLDALGVAAAQNPASFGLSPLPPSTAAPAHFPPEIGGLEADDLGTLDFIPWNETGRTDSRPQHNSNGRG